MKKQPKVRRYTPKGNQPADKNIIYMLMPSFIVIILCTACLIGLTFAWFTASVEVTPQKLTAANFDLDITVADDSGMIAQNADKSFSLNAGISYSVTLTPTGKADRGYCIVHTKDLSCCTDTIKKGDSFGFTLIPGDDADFTFVPAWGLFEGEVNIKNSSVFTTPSTEETAELNEEPEEYNFNEQPNSEITSADPIPTVSAPDESATENVPLTEAPSESVSEETTLQ